MLAAAGFDNQFKHRKATKWKWICKNFLGKNGGNGKKYGESCFTIGAEGGRQAGLDLPLHREQLQPALGAPNAEDSKIV